MLIPGVASALLNVESSFYYCGIEISKSNFDIKEFSKVCSIINDLKHQLSSENAKELSIAKNNTEIIGVLPLGMEHRLLVSAYKDKIFIGLYNKGTKGIEPINKNVLFLLTDDFFTLVSRRIDVIAARYNKGITPKGCDVKNFKELLAFNNYKQHVEKLSSCFYHTYELEFVNGYRDYVLTDEQLKHSLEER